MNLYRLVSQGRKKHRGSSTRVHSKEPNLTTYYITVTTTPMKPTTPQPRRGSSSRSLGVITTHNNSNNNNMFWVLGLHPTRLNLLPPHTFVLRTIGRKASHRS